MFIALEAILWFVRFLFGACIFSFLNVVAARMPRKESVVKGRSHCTDCGRVLTAWELIPCISFLLLKGQCKGCKSRIPVRDFCTEVIGGAAFIGCVICYGCGNSGIISSRGAVIFVYLGILLAVSLIDWDTQMIYDRFHILILLLGIAALWLFPEHGIRDRIIGASVISIPMLLLSLAIPGAFGGGDMKLMAASGFFLGTAGIVCAMFFGLLTGGGYGAVMLAKKRLKGNDHFAFGPFLAFGLALSVFFGERIVSWYVSLL